MEETKKGRGRPRFDAHITEQYYTSRRQAVNKTYMQEGAYLLKVAATEIPGGEVLYSVDRKAMTMKSRDGILEQLGRMVLQDHLSHDDCVYLANLAIAAVKEGYTTREVEIALRKIRMAAKSSIANPESKMLDRQLGDAVDILRRMGTPIHLAI